MFEVVIAICGSDVIVPEKDRQLTDDYYTLKSGRLRLRLLVLLL